MQDMSNDCATNGARRCGGAVARSSKAYVVAEGATLTRALPGVLANDIAAGPLTAVLTRDVSNGTLTLDPDGSFTYTHDGSTATSP